MFIHDGYRNSWTCSLTVGHTGIHVGFMYHSIGETGFWWVRTPTANDDVYPVTAGTVYDSR